ncbi:hypothetical protein BHE74_00035494 [Ensete ventricosum]|nr:hypothetical protein BHE74_00035494 [Ensete ventricosum]
MERSPNRGGYEGSGDWTIEVITIPAFFRSSCLRRRRRSGSCRRVGSGSSGGDRVGGQGLAVVFRKGGSVQGWRGREIIGHGGDKGSEGRRSTGRSRREARAAGAIVQEGRKRRRRGGDGMGKKRRP